MMYFDYNFRSSECQWQKFLLISDFLKENDQENVSSQLL